MTRADWIEAGAIFCVASLWLGLGAAFLIDGMGLAAVIGTLPSWVFVLTVRFHRGIVK